MTAGGLGAVIAVGWTAVSFLLAVLTGKCIKYGGSQ